MEDDHVDRTGVEVQQCMKLTVTNSSIDFFVPIDYVHRTQFDDLFCLHADVAFGHYAADPRVKPEGRLCAKRLATD